MRLVRINGIEIDPTITILDERTAKDVFRALAVLRNLVVFEGDPWRTLNTEYADVRAEFAVEGSQCPVIWEVQIRPHCVVDRRPAVAKEEQWGRRITFFEPKTRVRGKARIREIVRCVEANDSVVAVSCIDRGVQPRDYSYVASLLPWAVRRGGGQLIATAENPAFARLIVTPEVPC
ncbi:MAG: hypothetical protein KatS3mg082_1434 [Nitrospiraceae bacterium]|nr:MAG: hypothetical protein KatS3mg082_1434 [Nitrospiraceae bacterium]